MSGGDSRCVEGRHLVILLWHGPPLSPLPGGHGVGATALTDALREAGAPEEAVPSEPLCSRRNLSEGLLRKHGVAARRDAGWHTVARVLQKLNPLRRAQSAPA